MIQIFFLEKSGAVMLLFTLLLSGRLMKWLGIRRFLLLGCICYGGGTLGCGLIQGSTMELYLYYGVLVGIGTAILYPTLTSYAVRLFSRKIWSGQWDCSCRIWLRSVCPCTGDSGRVGLAVFSFGGFSTLLAPATSSAFGVATLGENYSVMFSIFSLAGIVAPLLVTSGGYRMAYTFGLLSSLVGVVVGVLYFLQIYKTQLKLREVSGGLNT